ncbi:MAG: hypothetical protein KIT33_13135 [Candidatus Kapabacteria bacterium]|nr:hypothetical protein [Ignavibacteriota bacterium]MCW5885907.1 hypothetical protein [Candidatus Kapabacteria bacterium]
MKKKDKIERYDKMLQKHIDNKDCVKIYRTFQDTEKNISGFILSMTKDYLLVQLDYDFTLNGYSIIRKDQFESLRCNKDDKIKKRIFQAEGIIDRLYGLDKSIPLTNWQDIFTGLKKLDYHIIVECENKRKPKFLIGPIQQVTKSKISIWNYDPSGKLDLKYTTIKFDDITIVTFGDNYSTTFRKYLKSANKKE